MKLKKKTSRWHAAEQILQYTCSSVILFFYRIYWVNFAISFHIVLNAWPQCVLAIAMWSYKTYFSFITERNKIPKRFFFFAALIAQSRLNWLISNIHNALGRPHQKLNLIGIKYSWASLVFIEHILQSVRSNTGAKVCVSEGMAILIQNTFQPPSYAFPSLQYVT